MSPNFKMMFFKIHFQAKDQILNRLKSFTAISSESGGSFRLLGRFLAPVFLEQQDSCLFGVWAKKLNGLSLITISETTLHLHPQYFFSLTPLRCFCDKKSVAKKISPTHSGLPGCRNDPFEGFLKCCSSKQSSSNAARCAV